MKRLLFVFALALVSVGFSKDLRNFPSRKTDTPLLSCRPIIFINTDNIPSGSLAAWNTANQNHLYTGNPPASTGCTHHVAYIDATRIPTANFPNWLKDNQAYICYPETNPYIECEHLITDSDALQQLSQLSPCYTTDWENFTQTIGLATYRSAGYERHMSLSGCDVDGISLRFIPFGQNKNCYSIPFLRSIEANHGHVGTEEVKFYKINDRGAWKYVFSVRHSTGTSYYNFSQVPPFLDTPMFVFKFSPI